MPLYMDRHDLDDTVNAEHVAQIHQEDLKIEHEFGCKGLTYWFDQDRRTAFCLIKAPSKKALQDMHNKAHGAVPNSIIEVDPLVVESFLGRIEDPVNTNDTPLNIIKDPAFRVLLMLRLSYFVQHNDQQNEIGKQISEFHANLNEITKEHEGRIVRDQLNTALISFRSVSNAMAFAVQIQSYFESFTIPEVDINLNIGISSGVPISKGEGFFEEGIKLAERLCRYVEGKIAVSSEVMNLYRNDTLKIDHSSQCIRELHPMDERFLNLLMEYTESNWNRTDLKVNDYCSYLGLSKSQLYRNIKAITGDSLNIFVKNFRLNRALELLERKERNISEIAFDTGFNSAAYFSKCFYETYGVLPSDYLKKKMASF